MGNRLKSIGEEEWFGDLHVPMHPLCYILPEKILDVFWSKWQLVKQCFIWVLCNVRVFLDHIENEFVMLQVMAITFLCQTHLHWWGMKMWHAFEKMVNLILLFYLIKYSICLDYLFFISNIAPYQVLTKRDCVGTIFVYFEIYFCKPSHEYSQ